MNTPNKETTSWVERLAAGTIRNRWLVIGLTLLMIIGMLSGLRNGMKFDTSYRIFFSEDNPQLQAFDVL